MKERVNDVKSSYWDESVNQYHNRWEEGDISMLISENWEEERVA